MSAAAHRRLGALESRFEREIEPAISGGVQISPSQSGNLTLYGRDSLVIQAGHHGCR